MPECSCAQQRSGCIPKTCSRWYCQARAPTDEGTKKKEKLCCICRTGTAVVVMTPATRSSPLNCQVADFSSSNYCRISSWEPGNTQQNRVRAQRVQGLDRQAERTATLTLASCVLPLLLLLLLLFCCKRSFAVDRCRTTVVVMAPATRSALSLLDTTWQVQVLRLQTMPSSWGTRKHTTKPSSGTNVSMVRPTSQAYSDADPGLGCPIAAAAAACC